MIMQLALRRYVVAAGVALVGAGLIQVTPVVAPHVEGRGVDLAAVESLSDVLPNLGDLTGTFADGASSLAALDEPLLDPGFWQAFWDDLLDPSGQSPWLLLTGAVEQQFPVVGGILESFGLFVVLPASLLLGDIWSEISQALGLDPYAAAAEGLGTGLQGIYDAGVIDSTTLVQDVGTALDPSTVTSVLDVDPIADIATVVDPTTVPELAAILTSLVP
jgi:hypothetical protein